MTSGGVDGSLVSFEADESTLSIRDELEGVTQAIEADSSLSPQPALEDLFYVPVDGAVSFTTEALTIGPHANVLLRDEMGDVVTEAGEEPYTARRGTYFLDITGPVKTYVRLADVAVTLAYPDRRYGGPVQVTLGSATTVTVGARSQHSHPEATIVVPDDPAARMEAFSYLGSAVKEFSPERSWPTLRGHPPRIERGPELRIPSSLSKPDTGITVTIPENHADLYRVAPLAFYLGGSIEPGETPELHLPNGYVEPLVTPDRSLEESVERIVSKCFLLDTLVRQDGYVPITIRSYADVAPHLPFYPESIADEPPEDQLLEYFEAPEAPVLDALPRWPAAAVLRPSPADVTLVPHLLDSMAHISVAETAAALPPATMRGRPSSPIAVGYSHPDVPAGGVALAETAFDHRLADTVAVADETVVAIVTDDPTRAELLRSHLDHAPLREYPERIDVYQTPTASELREILTTADLVVSDLPVRDDAGATGAGPDGPVVDCADGPLPLSDISPFRPQVVVLDGTRSPTPTAVVEAGATGALAAPGVTEPDPGLTVLGCLLHGFSLAGTAGMLFDARNTQLAGVPAATAVHGRDGQNAEFAVVEPAGPDEFTVRIATSPTGPIGVGGVYRNAAEFCHDGYHLLGSATGIATTIRTERVVELLADEDVVVALAGNIYAGANPATSELVERAVGHVPESDVREAAGDDEPAVKLNGWVIE